MRQTFARLAAVTAEGSGSSAAKTTPAATKSVKEAHQIIPFRDPRAKDAKNLLIHGIPRTATPMDVLRALRERKLVTNDYPLSNITSSVISIPRSFSLYRTFHLSFTSPEHTSLTHEYIRSTPLFPGFEAPRTRSEFTLNGAREFQNAQMDVIDLHLWTGDRRRESGAGTDGAAAQFAPFAWKFNRRWATEKGWEGRRVLLKGLPPRITDETVKAIVAEEVLGDAGRPVSETGLSEEMGVSRLPYSQRRSSALYALSFDTPTQAARAVRKLNMVEHRPKAGRDRAPQKFLMRAELVY